MIHKIDKRLQEASFKISEAFGEFTIVLVGYFQKLPPVGETTMYQLDYS